MEHTDARAAGGVERHGAGLFDRVRPPRTAAMGISSLLPSLRSIVRTKHVGEAYGGKRVAVDSYCWLHRGAYSCSVELVEGIPTDKFVTSFMKRAHMLRRCNVEAVYVFDGGRMPGKADEEADRRRARVEAKQKARAHKRAGNEVAANEMYQRAVDVSPEMALAVIEALKKDGFSTVVAPYEADAQMAYLVRHGFVDGVVTEDSDLVPHRCASVFFKIDNDGMGQEIRYADVVANRDLSFAGFTPDQFLEMCVMSGCDYLPSLPGVGIKKAHALMRRFKKHDAALRSLRFEGTPVPKKYEQGFKDALNVFKHQWVFCPVRGDMAHLSSAPPRERNEQDDAENGERERDDFFESVDPPLSREDALRLIGPRHSKETARGVADGALHPMTLEAYAPLPTSGAPKHRNPSVASFFPGASRPRPRSADAARETSALAALSTPRFRAHPASANAAVHEETEKTSPAVRTEPPRAPERWVTPPALTAANPSKRAFYALLRASPSRAAAESPLESRFGRSPGKEKEAKEAEAKRSRRTAVGLEGATRTDPDDNKVADEDDAAATNRGGAAEKREATEPPRAAAHPFYLTPRSTPASARSRYFAAPVAAPPAETSVSSSGRAEAAEAASNPASAASNPASAARASARAEKENETTTTTTTTTTKKPLFERFAFGAK